MNTGAGAAARTSRPVVLVSVVLTAALCFLGMTAYRWVGRSAQADKCAYVQPEGATEEATKVARNESLALALASIASARPAEKQSPVKEAEVTVSNLPPPLEPDAPAVSKEEILAKQKADAVTLDSQMLSEEVDPVWAPKVERATADAMARVGSSVHLEEVTCRETLCRAKVTHLDPQKHEQDRERLLRMPVIAGQALALAPSNDDRSTVLYFSRKGTYLSVLQAPMNALPPASMLTPDVLPSE